MPPRATILCQGACLCEGYDVALCNRVDCSLAAACCLLSTHAAGKVEYRIDIEKSQLQFFAVEEADGSAAAGAAEALATWRSKGDAIYRGETRDDDSVRLAESGALSLMEHVNGMQRGCGRNVGDGGWPSNGLANHMSSCQKSASPSCHQVGSSLSR